MNYTTSIDAAHGYAAQGWSVFACAKGSKVPPKDTNGFKDATTNGVEIDAMFSTTGANVAIATGEKSGVAVIDVDLYAGGSIDGLIDELGPLPETLMARTRAGGLHYFFRYPSDYNLGSHNGAIAPHVDLKADGGYVVTPPSWVRADEKGPAGKYEWINDEPLAVLPQAWVVKWAGLRQASKERRQNKPFENESGGTGGYQIPDEVNAGERNSAVLAYVGHLRGKGMPEGLILEAARDFNRARCIPPLNDDEIGDIVVRYAKPEADDLSAWPDPKELPPKYPAPSSMDTETLPATFAPYVEDCANRLQVPPEMIASPMIDSFGSVIGKKCAAQPKANDSSWIEFPTFWGVTVAPPAFLKSPSMDAGIRFVRELDNKAALLHAGKMTVWESESRVRGLEIEHKKADAKKAVRSGDITEARRVLDAVAEIKPPIRHRYIIQDTTPEARLDILIENPSGVMQLSDELDGHIATLKREGHEASRAQELQFHDGKQDYSTDRIKRGGSFAEAPRMSLYGSLQPAKVDKYLRDLKHGGNDDGYFQRLTQLGIWPTLDSTYTLTDTTPDREAERQARAVFEAVDAIPLERDAMTGRIKPRILKFDADAQVIFNAFLIDLENKIRQGGVGGPLMASHVGKYRGTLPKLALVIALAENPAATFIGEIPLMKAMILLRFFKKHARRIYAVESGGDIVSAHELLARIKKGQVSDGFSTRDVQRREWDGLATAGEIEGAVAILKEHGYLREEVVSTEGRPRRSLLIHPSVIPPKKAKVSK